ncbi:related to NADPH oxidase cytosolic protein p67phox [Rhynchosporium secalis]|uniref:Related to NADPH oxidase cytosolic protein p67phox n=1 Tax=Rhynchosporium secalis TaxID=38038 RepID=A0A1E1MB50_RHYSE|nr:related to NADPH oxidase cytosolic protein p67phox [Rhynchosporium secalis]
MSLKQEIETWVAALGHYDSNEFDDALKEFDGISDTSKILFNCGVIHATLGEHEKAVECYQRAVRLDQYLAVAYFQQGVSNFLVGDFEEALANFNDTLLYLRGNNMIDYAQLGLMFKLYSCEVLFNRGLCYIYLQQKEAGMQDFSFAVKEKVVEDHNVIDEAIREEAEGYTVFSIPVGVVYRPNQAKVKNLKTKDYLGKARLVAASDRANAFTGFAGSEIKNQQQAGKLDVKDDRPAENLSFAATNLVKPGLSSKRQQSEPPLNRNVFPPTPPPESEKSQSASQMSRGASVRNGTKPAPAKLNIERARPNERYEVRDDRLSPQAQRYGPQRSMSERPGRQTSTRDSSRTRQQQPRRRSEEEEEEDDYPGELYDMYSGGSGARNSRDNRNWSQRRQQPRYIEEEEEYASDYDDGSFDENDFEMVSSSRAPPRRAQSSAGGRGQSRRPEIRKIRVKVHSEDVRYIMIGVAVEFPDMVDKIREKFGLRKRFKIKVLDDDMPNGDMITMGDQDDLDMVIMSVKSNAKKERLDMGKMEVWVQEL